MFFNAMAEIAIITAVLALVSQAIQDRFINREQMKKQQEEMKQRQKKMKELMKKDGQKSKNELESLEKEMLESMQKMMSGSSKVMIASMVVFLPAFALLGFLYAAEKIILPIPLPWFVQGFDLFNIGTWGISIYTETNWLGWYFVSYLVITLVLNFARDLLKKKSVVV